MKVSSKVLSIAVQALNLGRMYDGSKISTRQGNKLTWTHTISPSPLGDNYEVRIDYKIGSRPQVYVIAPKPLARPTNKKVLPHCYDSKEQRLCLYYPDGREWNKSMLLSNTVVPWAYEWLYHYEIWKGNGGIWTGGGVHPVKKPEN